MKGKAEEGGGGGGGGLIMTRVVGVRCSTDGVNPPAWGDGIQLSATSAPSASHTRSDTSSSVSAAHLSDTPQCCVGVYAAAGAKMNHKWLTCCLCIIKQAFIDGWSRDFHFFPGSQSAGSSMLAGNGSGAHHRSCTNCYFGHHRP